MRPDRPVPLRKKKPARPPSARLRRLRAKVYERDDYTCWLCGKKVNVDCGPRAKTAATLDHVIPRSEGGCWTMDNLRTAHRSCNAERHQHVVDFDDNDPRLVPRGADVA